MKTSIVSNDFKICVICNVRLPKIIIIIKWMFNDTPAHLPKNAACNK